MTKREEALLKVWEEEAKHADESRGRLRTWLRDNHPRIIAEYDNHLLLKVLQEK